MPSQRPNGNRSLPRVIHRHHDMHYRRHRTCANFVTTFLENLAATILCILLTPLTAAFLRERERTADSANVTMSSHFEFSLTSRIWADVSSPVFDKFYILQCERRWQGTRRRLGAS